MEERRRNKRIGLSSKLLIKRLDGEDAAKEVDIDVVDVSKTGVGFLCSEALEIGAVYEASLTIWTKEVIHAFLEIVRIEKKDDNIFLRFYFYRHVGDRGKPDRDVQHD